jgi:hypothetical protein
LKFKSKDKPFTCSTKNISDGVGSQNGSNGTPLDPPLFWLDNIFKELLFSLKVWKFLLNFDFLPASLRNLYIVFLNINYLFSLVNLVPQFLVLCRGLKVLSSQMDPAKISLIRKVVIKERGAAFF